MLYFLTGSHHQQSVCLMCKPKIENQDKIMISSHTFYFCSQKKHKQNIWVRQLTHQFAVFPHLPPPGLKSITDKNDTKQKKSPDNPWLMVDLITALDTVFNVCKHHNWLQFWNIIHIQIATTAWITGWVNYIWKWAELKLYSELEDFSTVRSKAEQASFQNLDILGQNRTWILKEKERIWQQIIYPIRQTNIKCTLFTLAFILL